MDWKRKEGVTEGGGRGGCLGRKGKLGPLKILLIVFPKFCFHFFFSPFMLILPPEKVQVDASLCFSHGPQAARGLCTYLYMSSRHADRIYNTADHRKHRSRLNPPHPAPNAVMRRSITRVSVFNNKSCFYLPIPSVIRGNLRAGK